MQRPDPEQAPDPAHDAAHPSKTQRKRASHDLQDLGKELVALSEARLAELVLPDRLRAAIAEARRITSFGALRRQLQYVGKLMRDSEVNAAAIAARLEQWRGSSRAATAHLHLLERWRERLLADDEAIGELAQAHPGCDLQRVRTLVRNTRKEQAAGKPPTSYRELFQALRDILPGPGASTPQHPSNDGEQTT